MFHEKYLPVVSMQAGASSSLLFTLLLL